MQEAGAAEPPPLEVGEAVFARLSKVGMFYAATLTSLNADGTVAVDFRDLKKTAVVPRGWVITRDKADSRPVIIPHEIGTSRSPKEAKPITYSPSGGTEKRKAKLAPPPPGSPPTRQPASPASALSSSALKRGSALSPPPLQASTATTPPPPGRLSPPPSLQIPSVEAQALAELEAGGEPTEQQPPSPVPPPPAHDAVTEAPEPAQGLDRQEAGAASPRAWADHRGPIEEHAQHHFPLQHQAPHPPSPPPAPPVATEQQPPPAVAKTTPELVVTTPAPASPAPPSLPPTPPPQQQDWYRAEFADLLSFTTGGGGLWDPTQPPTETSRRASTVSPTLEQMLLMSPSVVVEPEMLAAEFNICSSHVRDVKEMLQSVQATISATNQLFEASQKEWLLTSQELRQQLETLQALPPPPPPSTPPPVAEKTSDATARLGLTLGGLGARDGSEPDLAQVLQEQEQVIRQQQSEMDELRKEREQLRREVAALNTKLEEQAEDMDRSPDLDLSASVPISVARSLEAKLKASEQLRLGQQQQQQQQMQRTVMGRSQGLEQQDGNSKLASTSPIEDRTTFFMSSLEPYQRLVEHTGTVRSIVLDGQSRDTLFTAADDMTIRVWTLRQSSLQWKCTQVLAAHEAAVQVVCLNTSGTVLFSGDALGTILIWAKSESGKGQWSKKGTMRVAAQPSITCLIWSQPLVTGLSPEDLALSGQLDGMLQGTPRLPGSGGSSSGAGVLYSGSMDGILRSWKYVEKRCGAKTKLPGGAISCLHEYNRYMAVGHAGGDLALVTLEDLQLLRVAHEAHSRKITSIVILGHKMFTASHDSTIKVWLLPNVECLTTLIGHYSRIECLALSTDHYRLYSGSADMSVMAWDMNGNFIEQGFVEHTDSVTALFSSGYRPAPSTPTGGNSSPRARSSPRAADAARPNSVWLFSGSADCTVQVWAAADRNFMTDRLRDTSRSPTQRSPASASPRAAHSPKASPRAGGSAGPASSIAGMFSFGAR